MKLTKLTSAASDWDPNVWDDSAFDGETKVL